MDNLTFTINDLPDESSNFEELQPGRKTLIIDDLDELKASTGTTMLQFTYTIKGTKRKINYDNCPMKTANGERIAFGEAKLKKIMQAAKLDPKVPYTTASLKVVLKGKEIDADIIVNDKGYGNIDGTKIFAVESANTTADISPDAFMPGDSEVTFNPDDL